jgi:hypothetical protein
MSSKQRKKSKKADDAVLLDRLAVADEKAKIEVATDAELFFEDTVGDSLSRKNRKKVEAAAVTVSSDGKLHVVNTYIPPRPTPKPFQARTSLSRSERAKRARRASDLDAHREEVEVQLAAHHLTAAEALKLADSFVSGYAPGYNHASDAAIDADAPVDLWDDAVSVSRKQPVTATTAAELTKTQLRRLNNVDFLPGMAAQGKRSSRNAAISRRNVITETVVAPAGLSINPHPEAHAALADVAAHRAVREALAKKRLDARGLGRGAELDPARLPKSLIVTPEEEARMAHLYEPAVIKPSKRKTRADRNKERRINVAHAMQRQEQRRDKVVRDLGRLPSILRSIEHEEQRLATRRARGAADKALRGPHTIKFGAKFVAPFPEVPLAEELSLTGSLRQAPVSTQISTDTFAELQRKNIIPVPRKAKRVRQYKPTIYTRGGAWEAPDAGVLVAKAEQSAAQNPRQFAPSKRGKGANAAVDAIAAATGATSGKRKDKGPTKRKRAFSVSDNGGHDSSSSSLSIFD